MDRIKSTNEKIMERAEQLKTMQRNLGEKLVLAEHEISAMRQQYASLSGAILELEALKARPPVSPPNSNTGKTQI